MIVCAAVLIECDDEQSVFPLFAVAHGLIHIAEELLARAYDGVRVIIITCRIPIGPIWLEVCESRQRPSARSIAELHNAADLAVSRFRDERECAFCVGLTRT